MPSPPAKAYLEKKNDYVVERNGDVELLEKIDSGSSSRNSGEAQVQGENKVTFSFFMTMLGFSMTFIVAEITPLILATCFTVIAYDLGAIDQVIWTIVTPYIATAAIAPFVGNLSDLLGRRTIILVSMVVSVISFVILAAAPNFAAFLVGQALCGMAIGVQVLTVISAASELVPVAKRGLVIGYIVMGFIPFAPATIYGQLIVEHNWRYVFLFIGLWAAIATVVLAIFYRPPPNTTAHGLTKREILQRIDFGGAAIAVLGLVVLLLGINWGGQVYAWTSWHVIVSIVMGVVILIIFGIYERYIVKYPLFPMRLVQNKRLFAAISVLCFTSGINFIPVTVFWTLQVYAVYGASFEQAGIWLLPLGFCILGGACISAILITVFKKQIMWVLLVFSAMQTIGIGCMSLFDPKDISSIFPQMIFSLIGVGAVLLPSQVVFSVISPDDLIGTSVALSLVIRMLGQVVGKSMFYNIFKTELMKKAPAIIGLPAIQAGFTSVDSITDLVTTMTAGPLSHYIKLFPEINTPEKYDMIVTAGEKLYAEVFPLLYHISIPFGAAACVCCLLLWGIDKYMDDHVAVHL